MINYCLPIIETNSAAVLQSIQANLPAYTYFEVWLDYLEDLKNEFVEQICAKYESKVIFLFRRKNLETPLLPESRRQEILKLLNGKNCLVDLDIVGQKADLDFLSQNRLNLKLIASYHNYKETPEDNKLKSLLAAMAPLNPFVFKLSCYCQAPADALRLLNILIELKKEGKRCIVLGMGPHSKITRVFGSLWGNEMVFAPADSAKASADGQISRAQLEIIFKSLE